MFVEGVDFNLPEDVLFQGVRLDGLLAQDFYGEQHPQMLMAGEIDH